MAQKLPNDHVKNIILAIAICFTIWCIGFIYKSSFIAIDGNRYFALFDDATISMRYAWNFSHGLGLVWNPGEYVEGYTNLLMTLIMSLATMIFSKSMAVLAIKIFGIGVMLGIAYLVMCISDLIIQDINDCYRALIKTTVFFAILSYYPLVYWSIMGMETGILTLLLSASILFALKYIKFHNVSPLLLASSCLGLAYLTRPDSGIYAVLVFSFIILQTAKSKPPKIILGNLLGAFSIYLLFVMGQTGFRWLYYGELVPNTYILKLASVPLFARLRDGFIFVKPFIKTSSLILFLVSIDIIFNFSRKKLFLFSFLIATMGYQVWVGGEPWSYWRILSPAMPLLFILFIQALLTIVESFSDTKFYREYILRNPIFPRAYATEFLVVSLTIMALLMVNVPFFPEISLLSKPYQSNACKRNINISIALNEITTDKATIGVLWGGTIPYYTGKRAVDFLGKSDKYIAKLPPHISNTPIWRGMKSVPGHNKYDLNYSIKKHLPAYAQTFKWASQDISEWGKTKYISVEYKNVQLFLLKDSPSVLWGKIGKIQTQQNFNVGTYY